MIVFIISFIVSISISLSIEPKSLYSSQDRATLINTVETRNCYVSYVKIKGVVYLVKQKKDPKKLMAVIKDALSAWIAEIFEVAHRVQVISSDENFPGKVKKFLPATLHTLAPGKTVREQKNSKFNALRLRQLWARATSFNEKGLTKPILHFMSWHRQLPIIVALDLFIGNSDRHCGNLCYDPEKDSFCAIDMDDTFNKDLCAFACKKLKAMMHDKNLSFSKEEIRAIIIMRDALKLLLHTHKPNNTIKKLYYFAYQAGFSNNNSLYDVRAKNKLKHYEKIIRRTYISVQKLINLLNIIVMKYS